MKPQSFLPFGESKNEKISAENKEPVIAMVHEDEINRLEQFVEKLIEDYQGLKAENKILQEQLHETEQKNHQSQELVSSLQNDRSILHTRVTGMIGKIEQWEKTLQSDKKATSSRKGNATLDAGSTASPQTFSMGAE